MATFSEIELLTLFTICSTCILTMGNFLLSRFGIEGGIRVLVAPVPGHCLPVSFSS